MPIVSILKKSTAGELLFDGYEDTLLSMADMMAKEGDRPMITPFEEEEAATVVAVVGGRWANRGIP